MHFNREQPRFISSVFTKTESPASLDRFALLTASRRKVHDLRTALLFAGIIAICGVAPMMGQDDGTWKAAVGNYRQQIRTYHFADAYGGMKNLVVERDSWQQSRSTMITNAHRLMKWKTALIQDLNNRHFFARLRDKFGNRYLGIQGASEQSLTMKVSYGTVELPWTRFTPETLIGIANSFINKGLPDAAGRDSLCRFAASELAHPAAGVD